MTFNANQWYTTSDLARAGIRNDQALQLLIARGVLEVQGDGYSDSYLGKGLLLAIDAGKIRVGEPIELSSGKRAAAQPAMAAHRPAARKSAIPQQILPAIETGVASPQAKARPQPSLQVRYDTMSTAWRELVDEKMASCGGDRVRAAIAANRAMPGLAQRVDALCNELRQQAASETKLRPKLVGTARERLTGWLASGKRGACRLA